MNNNNANEPARRSFKADFEEWLRNIHAYRFPMLLDDDMPDHFEDWLTNLQVDDLIEYANQYAQAVVRAALANVKEAT